MSYKVGDLVVYPNHGVARIEQIVTAALGDREWSCYRLRILANNAAVMVPIDNVDAVGIRPTIGKGQVREVFDRLRQGGRGPTPHWKGRMRENSERLRGGRLAEVAEVLGCLAVLREKRPLSYREKLMHDKARELVIRELAAAEESSLGDVSDRVDRALEGARN